MQNCKLGFGGAWGDLVTPTTGRKRGRPTNARGGVELVPAPIPKIPLNTLDDVRREAARVYREARARKLETSEASKLSFMLQGLAKMIEATVIERRLTALEVESGLSADELGHSPANHPTEGAEPDVFDVQEIRT